MTARVLAGGGSATVTAWTGRTTVTAAAPPTVTVAATTSTVVTAVAAGPQGGGGEPGPQGPPGPTGPLGGYVHVQETPSASWQFTHEVGRLPVVITYDGNDKRVFPDTQVSATQVQLTFAFPMRGTCILL